MRIMIAIALSVSSLFCGWSNNAGAPVSVGNGIQPQLAATADGGLYVAWLSDVNFHIYLQRLDAQGNPLWQRDGILVSDAPNSSWIAVFHLNLVADSEGNAIISTVDTRSGNWEVHVFKIDPLGHALWGASGLTLSNSGSDNISPRMALVPEDNSVVVSWTEDYASLRLQRIQADGTLLWGASGIQISDAAANLMSPQCRVTDAGTILVQWIRQTGSFPALSSQVMVQGYDLQGTALWNAVAQGPSAGFPLGNWSQDLLIDPAGCFSSWTELTGLNQTSKIRHMGSAGNISWLSPVEASTQASNFRVGPRLATVGGTDQVYVVWTESDANQNNRGITAQRISAGGTRQWGATGIAVENLGSSVFLDLNVSNNGSDLITAYIKELSGGSSNVYASRMTPEGTYAWAGNTLALTNSGSPKDNLVLIPGPDCWFLSWEENGAIRAHCLLADGSLGAPPAHLPGIIEVPQDFSTIQSAIAYAMEGDTVLVHPGVYPENLNFLGKNITLGSLTLLAGDSAYISQTIVDGGGLGAVVVFEQSENSAQLIGFTLQNGSGHFADPDGDGISSFYGGAIYCFHSAPLLSHLLVQDNTVSGGGGGGLFAFGANVRIHQVVFRGNSSNDVGGAIYARSNSDLEISNSEFYDNHCADVGGALYARDSSDIHIDRSLIFGNISDHAGAAVGFKNGCTPLLTSVTITNNVATHFGGAVYSNASFTRVVNSILWNNGDNEIHFADFDDPSQFLYAYTDLDGGVEGITTNENGTVYWEYWNITADPLFRDTQFRDYSLSLNSPCRDVGTYAFEFNGETLVDLDPALFPDGAMDLGALEGEAETVNLLPLTTEFRWDYRADSDIFSITLQDTVLLDEHGYYEVDHWYNGENHIGAMRVSENRVWTWIDSTEYLLYDFAAAPGESWPFPGEDGNYSIMSLVSLGDTVVTELGTFTNCTRFSRFIASDYEYIDWFAEDVGLVQRDLITIAGPIRYQLVGMGPVVGIDPLAAALPDQAILLQNYPNPFNPTTTIRFLVNAPGPVQLAIYDTRGQLVQTLMRQDMTPGSYTLQWDGLDQQGQPVGSGLYLCRLKTQDRLRSIKMVYLK